MGKKRQESKELLSILSTSNNNLHVKVENVKNSLLVFGCLKKKVISRPSRAGWLFSGRNEVGLLLPEIRSVFTYNLG